MHVKITSTGQVITLDAFYGLHPNKTFGGVPSDDQLAAEGACWIDDPLDITAERLKGLEAIDRRAQILYDQSVASPAIQEEYKAAYESAVAFLALSNPASVPARLAAMAAKFDITPQDAARVVVEKTQEGYAKLELRGAARLTAKAAVEAAETAEAVREAVEAGYTAMAAITFTV